MGTRWFGGICLMMLVQLSQIEFHYHCHWLMLGLSLMDFISSMVSLSLCFWSFGNVFLLNKISSIFFPTHF